MGPIRLDPPAVASDLTSEPTAVVIRGRSRPFFTAGDSTPAQESRRMSRPGPRTPGPHRAIDLGLPDAHKNRTSWRFYDSLRRARRAVRSQTSCLSHSTRSRSTPPTSWASWARPIARKPSLAPGSSTWFADGRPKRQTTTASLANLGTMLVRRPNSTLLLHFRVTTRDPLRPTVPAGHRVRIVMATPTAGSTRVPTG